MQSGKCQVEIIVVEKGYAAKSLSKCKQAACVWFKQNASYIHNVLVIPNAENYCVIMFFGLLEILKRIIFLFHCFHINECMYGMCRNKIKRKLNLMENDTLNYCGLIFRTKLSCNC